MVKYWLVISCVSVLVFGVLCDHLDPCPQHRGLPDGWRRADNLIDGRSLYRLDLRSAIRGYQPNRIYRLRVHTTSRRHKFNDASLMLDPLDPDCGIGRLIVDDQHYSPKDCPDFVSTQQKEPMGRAHFKWEAPSCGCVHIRIRVHANSSYYIEDEYTSNGPLARTICPKADARVTTTITTTAASVAIQRSRTEKLTELCTLSKDQPMSVFVKGKRFMENRQMRFESEYEKERLAIALEQRQYDTERCCVLEDAAMLECFGDIRRRRIDQFCGTGQPDVPFTTARFDWIKQKESECCWQIGEDRYHCFNYTHDLQRMINDGSGHVSHEHGQDLDDFDPANDIGDFEMAEQDEGENNDDESHRQDNQGNEYAEADDNKDNDEADAADDDSHEKHMEAEDDDERIQQKGTKLSDALIRESKPVKDKEDGEKPRRDQVKKSDVVDAAADDDDDDDDDDEDDDEDDDDEDDDSYEVDNGQDNVEAPKTRGVDNRKLNPDICCFNGITAGTRVADKGVNGCFEMADRFNAIFTRWNKNCDRNFVVCCMRVVEGMSKRPWLLET